MWDDDSCDVWWRRCYRLVMLCSPIKSVRLHGKYSANTYLLLRYAFVEGHSPIAVERFNGVWAVRDVLCLAAKLFLDAQHDVVPLVVELLESVQIFRVLSASIALNLRFERYLQLTL